MKRLKNVKQSNKTTKQWGIYARYSTYTTDEQKKSSEKAHKRAE